MAETKSRDSEIHKIKPLKVLLHLWTQIVSHQVMTWATLRGLTASLAWKSASKWLKQNDLPKLLHARCLERKSDYMSILTEKRKKEQEAFKSWKENKCPSASFQYVSGKKKKNLLCKEVSHTSSPATRLSLEWQSQQGNTLCCEPACSLPVITTAAAWITVSKLLT